jgi:3-deoxy-D-manno-octulosonic-acid transferase
MSFLYNIGILIYTILARLAAPFNTKAKLWVEGRKNWDRHISQKISPTDKTVWIHCASLGEFEQGRPLIEAIRKERPGVKIVLTFFSPSGYEVRKNYAEADCISYLPADTASNAAEFIRLVHPSVAIIVKYEFWANYINAVHAAGVPLYLVSGIFRPKQHFFSWYGSYFRSLLRKFDRIFVQDNASLKLLSGIGITQVTVAGDTRFDRVVKIAASAREIPVISEFRNGEKLVLAGSSWTPDEEIMAKYINRYPDKLKWVFAPHEIHKSNIERLEKLFAVKTVRFSEYNASSADARVLIIDNIDMENE